MSTTNRQVAHIFAQANGAAARGSNFRCEDNRLYSYRTLIAAIMTDASGQLVTFISSNNMTPTTGKQLSYARSARPPAPFYTPAFTMYHADPHTAADMIRPAATEHIEQAWPTLLKRRNPALYADDYNSRRAEIIEIAARFNVTIPEIPEAAGNLLEQGKELKAEQARRNREAREARQAREAAQRAADAEQLATWLTTGAGTCPQSCRRAPDGTDIITIRGEQVITGQGAACPLDHARAALRFYLSRRVNVVYAEGKPFREYQRNGHTIHLGHFTLDSIDAAGTVRAGCHTLTAATIGQFIDTWRDTLKL